MALLLLEALGALLILFLSFGGPCFQVEKMASPLTITLPPTPRPQTPKSHHAAESYFASCGFGMRCFMRSSTLTSVTSGSAQEPDILNPLTVTWLMMFPKNPSAK